MAISIPRAAQDLKSLVEAIVVDNGEITNDEVVLAIMTAVFNEITVNAEVNLSTGKIT